MHVDLSTSSPSLSPIAPSSTLEQGENQLSTQSSPNNLPIAMRKPTRTTMFQHALKIVLGI